MPYGCFVEIMPGKDGLLHISEINWNRLNTVEDAGLHEGDKIKVKLRRSTRRRASTSSPTVCWSRNRKATRSARVVRVASVVSAEAVPVVATTTK